MHKNNDYLSPDSSPQKLQTTGVKRVNNMPLFIAIGVLTVFVLLIAFVALKRANAQNLVTEPAKLTTAKKNTMSLAYEVIGNRKPETNQPVVNAPEPTLPVPPPQNTHENQSLDAQSVPDAEMERIRQEKTQAFEEAVNAKTSIMVDNARLNAREITNASTINHDTTTEVNVVLNFKEQLNKLQARQNARPMPQTLGGEEGESRWHLNSRLESPNSRFELRAGSVIPGVMVSGISSELPGQIIGQVSQNVYDTATGKYLLIPQGTKVIGLYSSDVSFGQDSVLVAWQRLVFPDGKALDIGSMPGADNAGYAGFRDQVDHHYARIYGSALLMSGIVAGITYSQNTNQTNPYGYNQPTAGSVLSQALGQQLGEVTSQMVSKNLNISPTINIRPGYRFNIIVIKDLTFKSPYRQFAY
ncbi:TPA: conjugal transfer protein TrbI [Legionella pneumophila subsp. pneumophila]|uniref:TrbI/VirB10 family protein n=1 Tax=Legionella pneumophila TaxID=446 RepID=UPI00015275A8|nr:TrbI/VirB10 family protein [Legionella pneumophila]ABQ54176.1 Conjugal transfer protein trbI [Legionella pneumophila str. Corby]ADG23413.1 type IV secretion system protein VirB10 [Legionella pneumophila 2300/99 Alcoy]AOW58456.1 conjugal transfer protein TrbI [Legionella pneumophila subsp. pneumophila]AOW61360.1 conjugal transfer protein TrbI [Legionella pneumophila subsp. pneumophila]AOW66758.1 conjugal transfer protein TrbI [Legionella pneumophila subsp. pneumophila]